MLMILLSLLLLSVTKGLPLAKKHNSSLISEIMSSKDNQESLMSILVNADPAKLNEVIVIVEGIIQSSEAELAGLTTDSDNADAAYESAVAAHDDSLTAQTTGENELATALATAQAAAQSVYDISNSEALASYNQGKAVLQSNVDTAEASKQSASLAKSTANGILAAERSRLESEIATLRQVITLIRGVIGINTFGPSASPTSTRVQYKAVYNGRGYCSNWDGGAAVGQHPTVESCMQRCINDFNSQSFAIYLTSWGYSNEFCECVPAGKTCSVSNSPDARNYRIVQA